MPSTFWGALELFTQASVLGLFAAVLVYFAFVGCRQTVEDYREAHRRGEWDPWR